MGDLLSIVLGVVRLAQKKNLECNQNSLYLEAKYRSVMKIEKMSKEIIEKIK